MAVEVQPKEDVITANSHMPPESMTGDEEGYRKLTENTVQTHFCKKWRANLKKRVLNGNLKGNT